MSERTSNRLRQELEDDILRGHYKAGERLDEVSLGNRFGVSRTPIREAFSQLAASGLIELRPRKGAFVQEISFPEMFQMFEVMAELEAMCGRLAARRMSEADHKLLQKAYIDCEKAEKSGDVDFYYDQNEIFHGVIYDTCGNSFLSVQTKQLRNRLKPYRRMQLYTPNRLSASMSEHQKIVNALIARDEEAAMREIKDHILIQGGRFSDFLSGLTMNSLKAKG